MQRSTQTILQASLIVCLMVFGLCQPLQLYNASIVIGGTATALQGSIKGGTTITISGVGFDPIAEQNIVKVGTYVCTVVGGNTNVLTVVTPDPSTEVTIGSLAITVQVDQQLVTLTSYTFSYSVSQTPYIYNIYPSSGVARNLVKFYGIPRVADLGFEKQLGDVKELRVDTVICDRINVADLPRTVNANSFQYISCNLGQEQQAGQYKVSQLVTPGYAVKMPQTLHSNFNPNYNQFTVLPNINALSQNSGGYGGALLTITGTGFSTNLSKMEVKVDGVKCIIQTSTNTQIKCQMQPKTTNTSTALSTNSNSQNQGYISGSGFKYQRYDTSTLSTKTIDAFRANILSNSSIPLLQTKIVTELETINLYGSNYGQVFKGYFYAPVGGDYKFRGSADDKFKVFLSSSYGSVEIGSVPIIYADSYTYPSIYISNFTTAIGSAITLQANKYYYMQVYHMNDAGSGAFKLEVQTPNPNNSPLWQSHEINQFTTNIIVDPQIVQFTQSGEASGSYMLKVVRVNTATLEVTYDKNVTLAYNASLSTFIDALNQFDCFSGYGLSGSISATGNVSSSNLQGSTSITYAISINAIRPTSCNANSQKFQVINIEGRTTTFTQIKTQNRSPGISGTFTINIGSQPVANNNNANLPYDISASALQAYIRTINGLNQVVVQRFGSPASSATWIIYYIGYNGDVPDLVISPASLLGGKTGTSPTVAFWETRKFSNNLIFNPIDYRFLFTNASSPNVQVKVNGLTSVCSNNCTYSFITNIPEIILASLSGSQLNIGISNPNSASISLSNLTITFDGLPCTVGAGTLDNFNCQLNVNTDGSPIVRAGSYFPIVTINNIGRVYPTITLTKIIIPLTISSTTPATGGTNGGYQINIVGNGFPLTQAQAQVSICGSLANIVSISNTNCVIIVPGCANAGVSTITLFYGSINDTQSFTYTTVSSVPTITAVTPNSLSPVLKTQITITGTGFGTNLSAVTISLANASGRVYQLRPLTINDTSIRAGIPGGLPGQFNVLVNINPIGDAVPTPSTANDFSYQLLIYDIQPPSGSYYGGTLINITGKNFSPDILETLVFVGVQLNWFCNVQTVSSSSITCRTPPMNPFYNASNQVFVSNRIIMDAACQGQCYFTYVASANSPSISTMNTSSTTVGTTITLAGSNFNTSVGVVAILNTLTKKTTIATPTAISATSITFILPNVESGSYQVKVRQDPLGESNSMPLTVKMVVSSQSLTAGLMNGGNLNIIGTGLPDAWPNKGSFFITGTSNSLPVIPTIVSSSPSSLVVSIPAATAATPVRVIIRSPANDLVTVSLQQNTSNVPILQLVSSATITAMTSSNVILQRNNLATIVPGFIRVQHASNSSVFTQITSWTVDGNNLTFAVSLPSGSYVFKAFYPNNGWATCTSTLSVSNTSAINIVSTTMSFNGGYISVTGDNISPAATLNIGGDIALVSSLGPTSAIFQLPPIVTPSSLAQFPQISSPHKITRFTSFSDSGSASAAFDGAYATFYSSTSATCYFGIDIGTTKSAQLSKIRYFPYARWAISSNYLQGGVFQASNDQSTWTTLKTIDQTVHAGWNQFAIQSNTNYRYVRFSHTVTSNCMLAEMEVFGTLYNTLSISDINSYLADVVYDDGFSQVTFSGGIQLRNGSTPVVKSVTPKTGDVFGNYTITISGIFPTGTPSVSIDGRVCTIVSSNSTTVACTVGSRLQIPTSNSFIVMIDNKLAVNQASFMYVMRWSDVRTWGTDFLPIEDDLIHVPKGMTLYVDQSIPRMKGIVVEGSIIFADEQDMTIKAGFITVNSGGKFVAGTQSNPYQNKLTFIMSGDYYDAQQPIFGNKGIGCYQCSFSMYGKPRPITWTMIQSTIDVNDTTLTLMENVDWVAGESIVIAPTGYDLNEAQQKTIVSITGNNTITVDTPFAYKHFAGVETYGTHTLEMRAEVGLLSRNIKMMGDQYSLAKEYGSHLMMAGQSSNGLVGHIAYSQFTHCGQPQIPGRYCMHFHMNGDVGESFVKGNAVHHSFARVITLHGVHFLRVSDNVGYQVRGHNYFVEDGIETNNVLDHNLAVKTLTSFKMLQTDISVASFWITNPYNHLKNNHAAGGEFYGFWYEIKANPDGPSSTRDVCPIGLPLGESHDNVAHSYAQFGLRIFKLSSRQYPCNSYRDDNSEDFWSKNPSIQSVFSKYTLYKNLVAGVLAEQTGNTIFNNFVIAESKMAGMDFYLTNYTRQLVIVQNTAIIGVSTTNPSTDLSVYANSMGIITPRTDGFKISGVDFYNFNSTMTILQTCSKCNLVDNFINTAREVLIEGITYTNVTSNYLKMIGLQRQIIYDLDGSFTNGVYDSASNRAKATVFFNHKYLGNQTACVPPTSAAKWGSTALCNQTVTVRRVMVTNAQTARTFKLIAMKVQRMSDWNELVSTNSTNYQSIRGDMASMDPMRDKPGGWAMPLITGRLYNLWWLTGLDWTSLAIQSSKFFTPADDGIIVRFNYTANRQMFDFNHMYWNGNVSNTTIAGANAPLDPTTCNHGDYFHNDTRKTLDVCLSGKGKTNNQYLTMQGVRCRYKCSSIEPNPNCVSQSFFRLWSNASIWPNGVIPQTNQNVFVNCSWNLVMDIQPNPIDTLTIDGSLVISPLLLNPVIQANNIIIRMGSLTAGQQGNPFPSTLTIQLNGNRTNNQIVFDPSIGGNKLLIVTGKLNLYGKVPGTVWTRLTQTAFNGSNVINVDSSTGWQVGDTIVLSPSFSSPLQDEKRVITAISSNQITLDSSLQYTHYGDNSLTIDNNYGQLDTRTTVGHLTRNIKIVPGPDSGWGYRMLVYGYRDTAINVTLIGSVVLSGVEMANGGQQDTQQSTLKFLRVIQNKDSQVTGSSFHSCNAYCLYVQDSTGININNNVLYRGYVYIVKVQGATNYKFDTNLMIGARKRPTVNVKEDITCYLSPGQNDVDNGNVIVANNVCQGSQLHGFFIPFVTCDKIDMNPFKNNTVGSAVIGFIITKVSGTCMAGEGYKAYACDICHMGHSPNTQQLRYSNLLMADCGRAVTLRFGLKGDDRTGYFSNSFITAISRPGCSYCYGASQTKCQRGHAVRMLSVTINGEQFPKFGTNYDTICQTQVFDTKAFITNVTFENYRYTYPQLPQCSNNYVFRPHSSASDLVGSHHLTNTICNNCEMQGLAQFDPPNPSQLSWFGGCGSILCTGKNNYLVQDHDGKFLPGGGTLVANNSAIGDALGCTFYPHMNGHHCLRSDLGVLEYANIAPDFKTRIMWPVNLTYDGSNFTTITNGYKEWEWDNGQPLNRREGIFISVIRFNQTYNMTFTSKPPQDMKLQFQRRKITGDSPDWIIVKLYYPVPNSIVIQANGITIKPLTLGYQQENLMNKTNICGANKYFYTNYTIHFVITAQHNCQVRVMLVNTIQLSIHFSMNITDFYSMNGITKFIDNMCALLKITDTSRLKVVGVYNGSVEVAAIIVPVTTPMSESTTRSQTQSNSDMINIQNAFSQAMTSGQGQNVLSNAGFGPVLSYTQTLTLVDGTSTSSSSTNSKTPIVIIIATIVGFFVFVGIVTATICIMRKRKRITDLSLELSSENKIRDFKGEEIIQDKPQE